MPRSGTNFLADALSKHSLIARSPGNFWEYVPFRFHPMLESYVDHVAESKHAHEFSSNEFLPFLGKAWLDFLAADVATGKIPLFKEPSIDHLESMFQMYLNCKAIFILRDGRDIVASALKSDFVMPRFRWWKRSQIRRLLPDEDFRILCRQYRDASRDLTNFLSSEAAERYRNQYLVVKYEALVDDSRNQLVEIIEWLDLDPDQFDWEEFGKMPVRGSSFLRGEDGGHDFGIGVERPEEGFDPKKRWADWSSRRLEYFDRVAGRFARELGYE